MVRLAVGVPFDSLTQAKELKMTQQSLATLALEKQNFSQAIVDHLFPHLSDADKHKIRHLFDHAFDHPWTDDDLKSSIVQNICNDLGIEVTEQFETEEDE